ncbi:heparan-alpha-glucosaminide N-acetyltransferase isoform X1 [Megalobrama amblycephala]|uniref:heparan-alpha-glucosaminide N-acetyltransferase isoform X1 n=2 Tax=Megalobrama amblycephala TaxID=75352 RepID=UPI002013D66C|nr:heparan-alpha-glucosaminide N-acetyltransferase isoform X1 [Megalobrama amblycephala]
MCAFHINGNDCCSCLRRSEFDTTGNYTSGMCERRNQVYMLKMDQALLTFHNELPYNISVYYTSDYCYKCLYQPLATVGNGHNIPVVVSTQFTLTLRITTVDGNSTQCSLSQTFEEAGHYSLWMRQPGSLNDVTCSLTVDRSPNSAYLPLLAAFLILASVTVFWASLPCILRCSCTQRLRKRIRLFCCHRSQNSMEMEEANNEHCVDKSKTKSSRLKSLDTFRGFSLTVMVFVNYGGGGYWFFQHAPWNGLTVADLVMPWFVFIIGTSVVLAFNSMHRKGVPWLQLLRKVTWRTIVLMLIGFCFMNYSPRDGFLSWSWLRIPGVLQRLSFTYFVLAVMQTFSPHREIPLREHNWWNPIQDMVLYWPEWLIIVLLETLWLCLTFLLPVPNCPTGYLGAGGIGDDGLYPNCTGGAAAYIDRRLFGDNIFWYPTCKVLYHTTEPFDPEGVLGTINSIVMGFFGMQAGKILLFFRKMNKGILARFLIWGLILGISAAILSKCTRDEGFIPVNKNLWSLSFVTCMGCLSFLLLGVMYFVVDVKEWWGGQPFIYPGMNSIFVYVGHSLLGFYFPFSWEMRFQDSHWEQLFQNMWGTALWVFIAYLLYRKKFFLKI